jgi:hypothetical protein
MPFAPYWNKILALPIIPYRVFVAVAILLAGCTSVPPKPKPILIGIDEQVGLGNLVTACAFRSAQAKATPRYMTPCLETPAIMVQEVRNAFQSAFEENPACEAVALKTYENASAMTDGVDWRMKFFIRVQHDGTVSMADSSWEIDPHVADAQSADGMVGDPYQAATRVCIVVKGHGGKVQ